MEIIHLILGKANPQRMNGVNKVVHQLATKQQLFGEKVAVWGIADNLEINFEERNFETHLFQKMNFPFSFSKELQQAIINKKGKAIFHLHGGWIPVYYSLAKLFFRYNIKFVLTPHGAYNVIAMKKSATLKKIYFYFFEKKILQTAQKIHCIGKSEVHGLKRIFDTDKFILLPYGFENNMAIELKTITDENIVFGFIGRLDIYTKGLDTLVKAFKKFHVKEPSSMLWIIGDSKEKNELQNIISKNLLDNSVIFYGSKFGKEKDELLQKMDVFVHPSRNEGLPLSVIEASSYGKPCIVTDATNIGYEVVKYNSGKTIYSQSSKKLEAAMSEIFLDYKNHDKFIEMQRNAIKMVKENYNWNELLLKFNTDLYQI
ncbi:glycosyltransferase family 4 protein [Flavobacterium sp. EDS]|uniref:glycosyltransferase family 4 protein n=1 Tax=Flavobacterium sp. EDS TaxID=2897328 RepID=UPI001E400B8D|nr:glycosyltransferase family 4 protein [Flavobacterium sp. EDS]MCD0473988.1 glycosyltransferase family 4 protein [Flavobacterium sp. EDS]